MTQKRLRKAAAYQPARTQGQTWDVLSRQGPSTQWDRLQREVLWVAMAVWNQDITDWSPLKGLWYDTGVRSARFLCCFQTKPRAFPGSQQRSSRTRERNAFRDKLLGAALMAGPDHSCLGPVGPRCTPRPTPVPVAKTDLPRGRIRGLGSASKQTAITKN